MKRMYEQDAKHKVREKQKKEGVVDYAENASIHGINYVLERNVVAVSRYLVHIEQESVHCWASRYSLGFEDEDLGTSPGWWATSVATYCPSRQGELPKFLSSKPCE